MTLPREDVKNRKTEFPIDALFVNRWSPRAMSGEELSEKTLMSLFEAARWAPSCFNEQPWRIFYARKNTPHFERYLDILVESNREWAKNAAALVLLAAKKTFTHNSKPNPTHMFDCGAAWENLALQGSLLGLVVHGMGGFDAEKARVDMNIPDDFQVCATAAIGKPGTLDVLSPKQREKEVPSQRKPLKEMIIEGVFVKP